jgi:hypothetical protein
VKTGIDSSYFLSMKNNIVSVVRCEFIHIIIWSCSVKDMRSVGTANALIVQPAMGISKSRSVPLEAQN